MATGRGSARFPFIWRSPARVLETIGRSPVSGGVPGPQLLQIVLEVAHTIAGYRAPAVKMAKDAVNRAFEVPLSEGLHHDRLAAFATEGQKESMHAFVSKCAPGVSSSLSLSETAPSWAARVWIDS